MRKTLLPLAALGLAALFFLVPPAPSEAHHGWGNYDSSNTLILEGAILVVDYNYPHAMIELEDGGKRWHIVLAPPSRMERRGIPPDELAVGLEVVVAGYASLPEPDELRAEEITLNGRTVQLR